MQLYTYQFRQFHINKTFKSALQQKPNFLFSRFVLDPRTSNYNDINFDSISDGFPNRLSDDSIAESFQYQEREHKRIRIEHRFPEMIQQIDKMFNLMRTLTDRVTQNYSNSERNTALNGDQNALNAFSASRSDSKHS